MYVYILVCIHICIHMQYVYMCICMYIHIHTYTQLHMYLRIQTCIDAPTERGALSHLNDKRGGISIWHVHTCSQDQNTSILHASQKCHKTQVEHLVAKHWKNDRFGCVFWQHKPPESVFHPCSPGFRAKNVKNKPVFHQKPCKGRTFHQNVPWTN